MCSGPVRTHRGSRGGTSTPPSATRRWYALLRRLSGSSVTLGVRRRKPAVPSRPVAPLITSAEDELQDGPCFVVLTQALAGSLAGGSTPWNRPFGSTMTASIVFLALQWRRCLELVGKCAPKSARPWVNGLPSPDIGRRQCSTPVRQRTNMSAVLTMPPTRREGYV